MPPLLEMLDALRAEALEGLDGIGSARELEAWRVDFLGRKGRLTGVLRGLKDVPMEERGHIGDAANRLKDDLTARFEERRAAIEAREAGTGPKVDCSLPGLKPALGHAHIMNQVRDEMVSIFSTLGFRPVHGPEVETVENNFESLNIGPSHPSRQPSDTFFLSESVLLRTHTSPVQIRAMRGQEPPIRICCPGRVYRREAVDATHSCEFHQVELLYVDRGVTMRDLKGCLSTFARAMFGSDTRTRFRPSYFPFVEPGAEVDISCFLCHGSGCRVCKGSGWIEVLGAGMVHPRVLAGVGYDPDVWTGYAAGIGVERITMLRHDIPDIRYLYDNDLRLLEQF